MTPARLLVAGFSGGSGGSGPRTRVASGSCGCPSSDDQLGGRLSSDDPLDESDWLLTD